MADLTSKSRYFAEWGRMSYITLRMSARASESVVRRLDMLDMLSAFQRMTNMLEDIDDIPPRRLLHPRRSRTAKSRTKRARKSARRTSPLRF